MQNYKLGLETAEFIRRRASWLFFGTLTYRDDVRAVEAGHHFRRFLRIVAKHYGCHVDIAWGEESQERGAQHHHLLLAPRCEGRGPPQLSARDLELLWRMSHPCTGLSRFVKYDPGGDAALYVARHEVWDVNVACPRWRTCKRTYCRFAPSPW